MQVVILYRSPKDAVAFSLPAAIACQFYHQPNKMIDIENNKHLCIIIQPRSGSHVLRHYLGNILNRHDLTEWFNPKIIPPDVTVDIEHAIVHQNENPTIASESIYKKDNLNQQKSIFLSRIDTLNNLSKINQYSVMSMYIEPYLGLDKTWLKIAAEQENIQFISLERADVLYSIISALVSIRSKVWHNNQYVSFSRNLNKFNIDINEMKCTMDMYIKKTDIQNEYFSNLKTIYYEQFQYKITNIAKLFNIPKKIISIPYNKFKGNHKDFVSNIDEVEDYYEEFVNKHPDYFPQYFGKLTHINIPSNQGRQPKILLPEYS